MTAHQPPGAPLPVSALRFRLRRLRGGIRQHRELSAVRSPAVVLAPSKLSDSQVGAAQVVVYALH